MTREEAIKVLRTESVEIGGNAVSVTRWMTALDMAVKALEDVTDKDVWKWISVKDRMPNVHQRVLVYCQSKTIEMHVTACMYMGGYFSRKVHNVTHWMPLPEPPEEGTV